MPAPASHSDLLLEGVQHHVPHRLIDAPKVEPVMETGRGFDWKPTVLVVAIAAIALLTYAYL